MELNTIPWVIQSTMLAAQGAAEARRADRMEARASDLATANRIRANAAKSHAQAALDSELNLIGALAEVARLQELVDELLCERSNLIAAAGDLLNENDRLRARNQ